MRPDHDGDDPSGKVLVDAGDPFGRNGEPCLFTHFPDDACIDRFVELDGPSVPRPDIAVLQPEEAQAFRRSMKGDRLEALWVLAMSLAFAKGSCSASDG